MFTDFEHKIISVLLEGNHPVLQILRQQLKYIKRIHRKNTGAGYYVEFDIQECPQILHKANFEIDDVFIRLQGQDEDAGCVLFIREGLLSFLEIYLYLDDFPKSPEILFFYTTNHPLETLKSLMLFFKLTYEKNFLEALEMGIRNVYPPKKVAIKIGHEQKFSQNN